VNKGRSFIVVVVLIGIAIGVAMALKGYSLYQATRANAVVYWQASDESNQQKITHGLWQAFLSSYLSDDSRGSRTLDYQSVTKQDKQKLSDYINTLQSLDPRRYPKNEQLAYWVNLYNALVINLVLRHYPIDSIKNIGDGLTGPWNIELATIAGKQVTLNQIEHGILRPLWQDNRIHYVINCASIGCPDLPPQPFSSVNINKQLNEAAIRFINQHKAVQLANNTLTLSSIYNWFAVDFGSSDQNIIKHIKAYALPELKSELEHFSGTIEFDYNWKLNSTKQVSIKAPMIKAPMTKSH